MMFGGAGVSWFSRTQTCVAMSSTKAEYIAAINAVKEAEFVRGILKFLKPHCERDIIVHEDNQGAITTS